MLTTLLALIALLALFTLLTLWRTLSLVSSVSGRSLVGSISGSGDMGRLGVVRLSTVVTLVSCLGQGDSDGAQSAGRAVDLGLWLGRLADDEDSVSDDWKGGSWIGSHSLGDWLPVLVVWLLLVSPVWWATIVAWTTKGTWCEGLGLAVARRLAAAGMAFAGLSAAGLSAAGLSFAGLSAAGLTFAGLSAAGLAIEGLTFAGLAPAGLAAEGLASEGLASVGLTLGVTTVWVGWTVRFVSHSVRFFSD